MNKQKGNMYDFVTHTANPIKGRCSHDCKYCYMKPIHERFCLDTTLRLDNKELAENYGTGKFIFIGSTTDMFANDVPSEWISSIYDKCLQSMPNKYLFQSKNPTRFLEEDLINHPLMQNIGDIYFATTIETNRDYPLVSSAPCMSERVDAMEQLRQKGFQVMVTMEPIMDFDIDQVVAMMSRIQPSQINIGCNTSRTALPEPDKDKLEQLILALRTISTVKLKSNIDRIL